MPKAARISIVIILLGWSIANTYMINTYSRAEELYPMTAWQMFSGRPKESARVMAFDIVFEDGDTPVTLMCSEVLGISDVLAKRQLQAVWKSCFYGCEDIRLRDYGRCRVDGAAGVSPWRLPESIAEHWLASVARHSGRAEPPRQITLVREEHEIDQDDPSRAGAVTRYEVLVWRPSEGRSVHATQAPSKLGDARRLP